HSDPKVARFSHLRQEPDRLSRPLRLPYSTRSLSRSARKPPMGTAPRALFVLVVEDLEDGAQSTAELLRLCGHLVRVTYRGADALRAAAEEVPDVVLLDIGLPGMDGWEVARRLRDQADGRQPFIVAVTGYGTTADRWRSADAGIDLH